MNRTPIRPMSKKRASLQRKYVAFVAGMLAVDARCRVCPIISSVDCTWRGCTRRADGLHHRRKKSSGGALMEPDNVVRACNAGNLWIEDHPEKALKAGLVVREGDPEWARLGR